MKDNETKKKGEDGQGYGFRRRGSRQILERQCGTGKASPAEAAIDGSPPGRDNETW